MKLLTVIIPVYNEEKFLRRCLDSVVSQKDKIDIIVIDDGSTDRSGEICDEYFARGDINLMHVSNGGVGEARNLGLFLAKTPYVTFLDADDEYIKGAVDIMIQAIEHFPHEPMISFNHFRQYSTPKIHLKYAHKFGNYPFYALPERWQLVWAKVFRRDFLKENKITFPPCQHGEDAMFIFECVAHIGYMLWIPKAYVIRHFDNPNSLIKTANKKRFTEATKCVRGLAEKLYNEKLDPEIVDEIWRLALSLNEAKRNSML